MYYVCHCLITQSPSVPSSVQCLPSNLGSFRASWREPFQKAGSDVQSLMGPARQIHAAPKIAPANNPTDIYATTTPPIPFNDHTQHD